MKEGERTAIEPEQDANQENDDEAEISDQDEIFEDPHAAFNSDTVLGEEEDDPSSREFLPEMTPPDGFDSDMDDPGMWEDREGHLHIQEDTPESIARILQQRDTEVALNAHVVRDCAPRQTISTPTTLSSDQGQVTAEEEESDNSSPSKNYYILLAVLVLAGIAIAVGVGVSKRNDSSQEDFDDGSDTLAPTIASPPTLLPSLLPQPSQSPTETPTSVVFSLVAEEILLNFGSTTYFRLLDSHSPQAKAARWIGETDVWFTFPLLEEDVSIQRAFRQRYALAVFYYSTGGAESWVEQLFFLSDRHECLWNESDRGIILCTDDRLVQSIHISGNNLTGIIPPELGVLEDLLQLTLSNNLITGTIPEEFYDLAALQILYLPDNPLSGTLSTNIGRLSNLFLLWIAESEMTGTLPIELGALTHLRALTLDENLIEGSIPEEWSSLSDLSLLSLTNNVLTGAIPQWIAGLSSLTTFSVYGNMLTGTIPVGDYSALSGFSVGRNNLTQGPFPQFLLGGVLKTLLLSNSGLTGRVPEDWTVAPHLFFLDWSRNAMTGTLPTSLGLLQDLWRLGAGFNMHMGTLPSELGNTGLAQLSLESNEFTGTIPETYLNLPLGKSMLEANRMHRCD